MSKQCTQPRISVIIPVYNTEPYLHTCLDSICNQTLRDIEIICINDCSPDKSLKILQEYALKDNRIKIIDFDENKGAATARNEGIKIAKGEYISFVDSDDYIDTEFLSKLYALSDNNNTEIIKGGDLQVILNNNIEVWKQNNLIKSNKFHFWAQFTTAIYNNNFLIRNNIKFLDKLNICEDIGFVLQAITAATNIKIEDSAIYYYRKRKNSLDSREYTTEKILNFEKYVHWVLDFIEEKNITIENKKIILTRIIAQIDSIRRFKTQNQNMITNLFKEVIIKKMRLK